MFYQLCLCFINFVYVILSSIFLHGVFLKMSHKASKLFLMFKFVYLFKNLTMSSPDHFKTWHIAMCSFVTPGIVLFLLVNADNKLANVL